MKTSFPIHVLYLSIDGMTEPLGQSQVLSYLKRISGPNVKFTIISFEKDELFSKQRFEIQQIVDENGINWRPFRYYSYPPILGTIFGLWQAWNFITELYKVNPIHIIHCRGNITPLLGLAAKTKWKIPFIFDMRGWGADEKLESGHWKKWYFRPVYHFFKRMETIFFRESTQVVSLTYAGKEEIVKQKYAQPEKVSVIPTCVDFDLFKPFSVDVKLAVRKSLAIPDEAKVLLYSGSLGGNYPIRDILFFFKCYSQVYSGAYFIVLCKNSGIDIAPDVATLNLNYDRIIKKSVKLSEVSAYIQAADLGLIYYERTFSVIGRSPTKLGEYWASGVPALSMSNIGDLDYISSLFPANLVLVDGLSENLIVEAIGQLDKTTASKESLRKDSFTYFGIENGVEFYSKMYEQLIFS